jgi:hypothetical protein
VVSDIGDSSAETSFGEQLVIVCAGAAYVNAGIAGIVDVYIDSDAKSNF